MAQYYVGLDVHSRQRAFAIEDAEGRVIAQGEVPTTPAGFEHLRAAYHLPAGTPRHSRQKSTRWRDAGVVPSVQNSSALGAARRGIARIPRTRSAIVLGA